MILVDVTESAKNRASDRLVDIRKFVTPQSLVQSEKLDYGDVAFAGNGPDGPVLIGVEIKSPGDCVQCIQTGRFAGHQLPGLVETYHHSWLLVEGEFRPSASGIMQVRQWNKATKTWGWYDARYGQAEARSYSAFMQWLMTMEVGGGVRIARTNSRMETAAWIAAAYWWWNKPWAQHKSLRVMSEPEHGKFVRMTLAARMAAQIPGIGFEKAIDASTHFKTAYAMVTAEESEWQKIKGIGKKTAAVVYEALRSIGGAR